MFRSVALLSLVTALGCAKAPQAPTEPTSPHPSVPFAVEKKEVEPPFDAKAACTKIIEHGVVVLSDDWADKEGIEDDPIIRQIVHVKYAEGLASDGTMTAIYQACLTETSPEDFECAMKAKRPADFLRCLR